jgi:hypothetical protein
MSSNIKFAAVINDCNGQDHNGRYDQNAAGRQGIRISILLGVKPEQLDVNNEVEAAGNLIDFLDAGLGQKGAILVNVAPRNGDNHKYPNGIPFCYTFYQETLIVTTQSLVVLGLLKKFGLAQEVFNLDIPNVSNWAVHKNLIDREWATRMQETQFRSYEFLPWIASIILAGQIDFPHEQLSTENIPAINSHVWWTDRFGNIKTILLPEEAGFVEGGEVLTSLGMLPCFKQLRDIPDGQTALEIGSSGLGQQRFLEIVVQGDNAAKKLNIKTGGTIKI